MIILNNSKNTIHLEDVDEYLSPSDQPEEISPDRLKKSRSLRNCILNGTIKVIEFDPKERIENSLMYLLNKMASAKSETVTTTDPDTDPDPDPDPEPDPEPEIEETSLETVSDNIEVRIHGLFYDASGYAKVNRNLALGLHRSGIKVKVDPKRGQNQLNEDELKPLVALERTPISKRNHIVIDGIIPSFSEFSSAKYNILYTTIESYTVQDQFLSACQNYDEIWLTSEWSASILRKYLPDRPIYTIKTGADPNIYTEEGERFDFKPNIKNFVFMSVFAWNYRKGPDVLCKAYFDEFSQTDDVSLLIMSRYQSGRTRHHREKIRLDIDKYMEGYPNKDMPHVVRFNQMLPENDMPKLYRAADVFILPTRGEGGCTLPGTKIITKTGLQHIEDIEVGIKVLTHKRRWKRVTDNRRRRTKESMFEIKTGLNCDSIHLTGEHPCLVIRKKTTNSGNANKLKFALENCEWVVPKDILVGDFVTMPLNFVQNIPHETCNTLDYVNNVITDDGKLYRQGRNQHGSVFRHPSVKPIQSEIALSDNFLKFLGFYISEGCSKTKGGQTTFTFHSDETEYYNLVAHVLKENFDTDAKVLEYEDDRQFRHIISCNNSLLNEMLANMCGRGSHNKHLPDFAWNMNKEQIKHLLYGIFCGDGCFYNPISSPSLTLSTVSRQLADEVLLALRMIGISACKQNKKQRGYVISIKGKQIDELREIKSAHFHGFIKERSVKTNEYVFMPVKEIRQYEHDGYVYNLEVADDDSYTTNCFTVHNCLPPLEASLCGLPIIMTNCSGQQGYLRADNSFMIDIDRIAPVQPGQMHLHYWDGHEFPQLTSPTVHDQVKQYMRDVYENYGEAKKRNRKMQQLIRQEFTWTHTANAAIERLKEINKKLKG